MRPAKQLDGELTPTVRPRRALVVVVSGLFLAAVMGVVVLATGPPASRGRDAGGSTLNAVRASASRIRDYEAKHGYRLTEREKDVFEDNARFVDRHNARFGDTDATLGGRFMHFTTDEFLRMRGVDKQEAYAKLHPLPSNPAVSGKAQSTRSPTYQVKSSPPASWDWRATPNILTPVLDQGQCACCYAFGAVGAMHGAYVKKHGGALTDYPSPQEAIECDSPPNMGCAGGWAYEVLNYAQNGMSSQTVYPYTSGANGTMPNNCSAFGRPKLMKTLSYTVLPLYDPTAIRTSV